MDGGPFDDPIFSDFGARTGTGVHSIQVMLGLHGNHHPHGAELMPPGGGHLHKLGNWMLSFIGRCVRFIALVVCDFGWFFFFAWMIDFFFFLNFTLIRSSNETWSETLFMNAALTFKSFLRLNF